MHVFSAVRCVCISMLVLCSVFSTLEPVACSLESSLRGIHTKHSAESTETVSMPGEPEYADLMAACLSWLTDVWVSLCK